MEKLYKEFVVQKIMHKYNKVELLKCNVDKIKK